jgi:Zn-dependent protease
VVISVHEASHAYTANRLGDPTARLAGRMTLNPLAHIDPIGTVLLPFVLIILGGFVFGWAKPTPINPLNFRRPFRDSALVAFAGPASNFLMAVVIAVLFRIFPAKILMDLVAINLLLGLFNLIPIPPLDGYKIVLGFLPKEAAARLMVLESYGPIFIIVFLLLFLQIFSPILSLLMNSLLSLLTGATL